MDSKKYEKLIDLIINENEDKAKELFHEIVVEQSRAIYESIMSEEMMGMDEEEGMGGEVGDLLDEITAEEAGVSEDEELDADVEELDGAEEVFDLEADAEEAAPAEEVEDAVLRIEDKIDTLMAEFEKALGGDEMAADDDLDLELDGEEGAEADDEAFGDESDEDDEMMQEAVQLQKVAGGYDQKIGGDDGDQKRSPVAADSGKAGMDSKPVHFSGGDEKGRSAPQTKDVKGAGSFKNAPGGKAKVDLSSAPKPVTKADSDNDKSPVAK